MFAGPNGSGKSTLKEVLPDELLGVYLNPNEIEKDLLDRGVLDLRRLSLSAAPDEVVDFYTKSTFLIDEGIAAEMRRLRCNEDQLDFSDTPINSYVASVTADFLRRKLLRAKRSFTIETVMSHPSKVQLLEEAKRSDFRTYLYYVATEDPAINVSRVNNRVQLGGHSVPFDKIVSRYHKSLDLLVDAIAATNRAYLFDNSGDSTDHQHTWLAEITDGKDLELKSNRVPGWLNRYVLNKAESAS